MSIRMDCRGMKPAIVKRPNPPQPACLMSKMPEVIWLLAATAQLNSSW